MCDMDGRREGQCGVKGALSGSGVRWGEDCGSDDELGGACCFPTLLCSFVYCIHTV